MTEDCSSSHAQSIGVLRVILSAIGLAGLLVLSYSLRLKMEKEIVVGVIRSALQLLFLGYVLLNILFSLKSLILILLYLLMMISIAALEVISRQARTYSGHYRDSFIVCLLGGGLVGLYGSFVIFRPTPWWLPDVMIPSCGMIIGATVSGPAISVERLLSEATERSHELETRLSFGATSFEAILPISRTAIQAALVPVLNQLAIIGLVSIPGMMTGQVLGGTKPMIAAEYQMAIMYLIVTTFGITIVLAVYLALQNAVFHLSEHRLSAERIIKGKKSSIDQVLFDLSKQSVTNIVSLFRSMSSLPAFSYSTLSSNNNTNEEDLTEIELGNPVLEGFEKNGLAIPRIIQSDNKKPNQQQIPLLELRNFNVKSGDHRYLFHNDGLNFILHQGEIVTIEGRSGLGKTRLLRAIVGLDIPATGYCVYQQQVIPDFQQNHHSSILPESGASLLPIPQWRCRIIFIPQSVAALEGNPKDFLLECLQYSARLSSNNQKELINQIDVVIGYLETAFGLSTQIFSEKKWNSLSGGERQRCIIICGFILALSYSPNRYLNNILSQEGVNLNHPESDVILLLDEPCAACDANTVLMMEKVFQESRLTMLIITHNSQQAERIGQRRLLFEDDEQKRN